MEQFKIPGHEDEKIIFFTRQHWIKILGPSLFLLLAAVVPVIALILAARFFRLNPLDNLVLILSTSIYLLILAYLAFYEWIRYYYDVLIVTEHSFFRVEPLSPINRKIIEVNLSNVGNITAAMKGFLPTFFQFGELKFTTAGDLPLLYSYHAVADPVAVASKILEAHNREVELSKKGKRLEVHQEIRDTNYVTEFEALSEEISESPPVDPSIEAYLKRQILKKAGKKPGQDRSPVSEEIAGIEIEESAKKEEIKKLK